MSEFLHPDVSISDFGLGETRKTWHKLAVTCILENVWGGLVRSRVTSSQNKDVRVGEIFSWTKKRWESFDLIAPGISIIIGGQHEDPLGSIEDLTPPAGVDSSGSVRDPNPPAIENLSRPIQHPSLRESPTMASLGLLEIVAQRGWNEEHFVVMRGRLIRFSQEGNLEFHRLSKIQRQAFIEELTQEFKQKGFSLIVNEV